MLRTAQSLPLKGLLTLGSDAGRFPLTPPACYRASWQLPGPDSHRQATTSLLMSDQPKGFTSIRLGARTIGASWPDPGQRRNTAGAGQRADRQVTAATEPVSPLRK